MKLNHHHGGSPPAADAHPRYDLAIIGRGMIGSAAARHAAKLSEPRRRIVLIGPSEPSNHDTTSSSSAVFGAHHDEGRITRQTDPDPVWAELATRSIARYEEIAREAGGMEFYTECGHLAVGDADGAMMCSRRRTAAEMAVDCKALGEEELREKFPHLSFPSGCVGLREREHAGYISARGLVAAQTAAARKLGVDVVEAVANRVERCTCNGGGNEDYVCIQVGPDNCTITANKVLVAAGSFCNSRPLLPRKLALTPIQTQTIHFVLSDEDAARLGDMPSIIFRNAHLWAYILPPIRYPDGTVRLKLGGACLDEDGNEYGPSREMHSDHEVFEWYRSDGNVDSRRDMERMLRSFIPLRAEPRSILSDTCATLNTPTRQAYIGEVKGGWAVATGGNGYAAKSSDELGRLAAICVLDQEAFGREMICGRLCREVFEPIHSCT